MLAKIQDKSKQKQEKRTEEKWSQEKTNKLLNSFFSFQNYSLWAYIKKLIHLFFGAWSFLLVHIRFPPNDGPTNFVRCCFKEIVS